ncbi:uncharacterized protein M6B38_126320 [Iris pallida]|uniref:Agenet domain-containing protein n=1 Tax=Iris pallida TaxID=29817 RepID=A0AAX6GMS8_IRIPA|nr:uncharacterized protein M6B38_126320 [Iris pallida]
MVMNSSRLPFEVGQEAESKSFLVGYRSAWFRCKIKSIKRWRGQIGHSLEFFDFPDEKVTWTKLYQKPPHFTQEESEELMVRPTFPPFYRESQVPDSYPECDVVAIVEDDWQVGDLVDWWYEGCYWSGRVSMILGIDKVQVVLPAPPIGEGKSYEAFCKDLRPSLNWSPEDGWTVPISRESGNCHYCVRLVQPIRHDEETSHNALTQSNEDAFVSHAEVKDSSGIHTKISPRVGRYSSLSFQAKVRTNESKYMPPVRRADTVESAIMELEEVALKIRWLKGLLQFGLQWSSAMKPSWKLVKNCGSRKQQ